MTRNEQKMIYSSIVEDRHELPYTRDTFHSTLKNITETGHDRYLQSIKNPYQLTTIDNFQLHSISDITNIIETRLTSDFNYNINTDVRNKENTYATYFENNNPFIKFDYRHLLSIEPKHIRHFSDWSLEYFLKTYFAFFKKFISDEIVRHWNNSGCCGRSTLVFILILLFFAIYIILPVMIIGYIFGSLFYPLICLAVTPWAEVDLLQFTLTCIYGSSLFLLCILLSRVLHFQHANYHFVACRDGYWFSNSFDAEFQIQKRYFDLISTRVRNELILIYFAELSNIMMSFLPELHEVDEGCVAQMEMMNINIDYKPVFRQRLFDLEM